MAPRAFRAMIAAACLVLVGACSGDDHGNAAVTGSPVTDTPVTDAPETIALVTRAPVTGPETDPAPMVPATDAAAVDADDIGVPGLDSEEQVCRSWSRFAGSFQLVAVASAFGDGGSLEAAGLEVAASTVVVESYQELIDNWPDELGNEADVVADAFLGPFARRALRALDELVAAGADGDEIAAIAQVWLDALASRDPSSPVPELFLDERLEQLVWSAARTFDTGVPPIAADPSLVTDVEVPRTLEYLEANCPDRGTLAGGDRVDG